ncbi:DsbA family protein [Corynebacterium halotolerans]|uniref:DsbA family protein n=1 Tax=Corynebacterium halotolerans TaxID=225326 RepID=UPI003CE9F0E5
MSNKIKSPNDRGNGFIWALVAILVIAVIIVAYIVYSSQGAKTEWVADREFEDVQLEATRDGSVVTLRSENATADTPEADLYEDYSCPHCSELAIATDDQMRDAVEAGDLVVNLHTLHFMDNQNTSGHSHSALAAALATVEQGDSDLFWNYRALLLEEQEQIANQWNNEDFANAAAEMGASDAVVEAINNDEFREDATALGDDNAAMLEEQTGSVSSPRVLQDGQDIAENDIFNWIPVAIQG